MDDDWRLRGQETYLSGATLMWKPYRAWSPAWEHDHCSFCWAKFMDRDDVSDVLREGYAAQGTGPQGQDDYHWGCTNCVQDFTDRFHWTVDGGPHAAA